MATTAPQTGRAAIEALARELTDDDWKWVLAFGRGPVWLGADESSERQLTTEEHAALLAYLDEVWAGRANDDGSVSLGLTRREKLALETDPVQAGGGTLAMLYSRGLIDTHGHQTPLCRAVLKRAKEQGR